MTRIHLILKKNLRFIKNSSQNFKREKTLNNSKYEKKIKKK